jgi:hypothetical protein
VVDTNFSSYIASGKLTFNIIDVGSPGNADIVRKYATVGSQLFLNIHRGNSENTINAGDLWSWNCTRDRSGFEVKIKTAIDNALNGQP